MTRDEKTAYWRHHVEGFQESGLSIRAYAEREAVAVSSLNYWRKRMGGGRAARHPRARALEGERFLPVRLGSPAASESTPLEIVLLSGHRLRLAGAMDTTPWRSRE